jgi:hypothetical protein
LAERRAGSIILNGLQYDFLEVVALAAIEEDVAFALILQWLDGVALALLLPSSHLLLALQKGMFFCLFHTQTH